MMNFKPTRYAFAAIGLMIFGTPAQALDTISFTGGASCISGTCADGQGTIRVRDGTEYTGQWNRGGFAPGATYKVRTPLDRNRVTELVTDNQGALVQGTELRGDDFAGVVGEYTGTYAEVANPFIKGKIYAYRIGKYTDLKYGYVYDGEFSYIPTRQNGLVAGQYIFLGARIDRENDVVVRGLFISDIGYSNSPYRFTKARPDYLVKLKREFDASRAAAMAEQNNAARVAAANRAAAAQAAEDDRKSTENFASVLGVMGGLLMLSDQRVGNGLSLLQDSSFATLAGGLTGQQSTEDVLQNIMSQVVQQAGADPTLARALGNTSNVPGLISNLSGLARGDQSTTIAQYEAQLRAARTGAAPSRTASTNAAATPSSANMCVNKMCLIGKDSLCSAPPINGLKRCQEGCVMEVGAFYHDTGLAPDKAYIGGTAPCGQCNAYCGPASTARSSAPIPIAPPVQRSDDRRSPVPNQGGGTARPR